MGPSSPQVFSDSALQDILSIRTVQPYYRNHYGLNLRPSNLVGQNHLLYSIELNNFN